MVSWKRTVFAAVFAGILIAGGGARAGEKEIVIGVHFKTGSGMSASEFVDMANSAINMVATEAGEKVRYEKFPSREDIIKAYLKGKVDGALLFAEEIVDLVNAGGKFEPFATYTVNQRRMTSNCFWYPKSAPITSASEIVGKTIVSNEFSKTSLLLLRDHLQRNGVDKPLWQVFKTFTTVPSGNSVLMAIAMNRGDLTFDTVDWDIGLKIMSPATAAKLGHGLCTDQVYARGAVIVNPKTVSKERIEALRAVLNRSDEMFKEYAKKDNGILQIRQYMKMAKAQFVPGRTDEFETYLALYRKAKKNGWLREAEFIHDTMDKAPVGTAVEVKPTYELCRSMCGGAKATIACYEKCGMEK